jgi:class 3 adenylate cyclase
VIGTRKFAYDVWGNTVNVASRLEQAGIPGRVHVSEVTRSLTESDFIYEPRGVTELRGVGSMTTYLAVAAKHVAVAETGQSSVADELTQRTPAGSA